MIIALVIALISSILKFIVEFLSNSFDIWLIGFAYNLFRIYSSKVKVFKYHVSHLIIESLWWTRHYNLNGFYFVASQNFIGISKQVPIQGYLYIRFDILLPLHFHDTLQMFPSNFKLQKFNNDQKKLKN